MRNGWKKELELEPVLPFWAICRAFNIIISADLGINRLLADLEDLAYLDQDRVDQHHAEHEPIWHREEDAAPE